MLLLLLTFLAVTIFDASPAPSLADTLAEVSSYSPRTEGSAAERDLLAMIRQRVGSEGFSVTPFDFSAADFAHSFSGCLRVDLPGSSRDTFILAVPVDSIPSAPAGGDGSINVALALDLLSRLAGTTPALSLTVLFLGAERGDGPSYPLGSTLFLRDFRPDYKAAFLYLALRDASAPVALRAGGRGIVAPSWLVGRSASALTAAGVPFLLPGDELQLFRMGTTNERTPIEPYLAGGYPAVGLETAAGNAAGAAAAGGAAATQDALARFLTGIVTAGSGGIPDEWDRHYLLLQGLGASLVVSEQAYVVVLICVIAAAFLYALVFRKGLLKYLRTLSRNAPALVPIAACTFLFLATGTYVLVAIMNLRAFPLLWTYAPAEFLALKLCVAVFLYAVLYNLFRRLPFPRNGSFFSASALLFLLVDIIVIALFNISFTWYFAWAFVFVFLSAVVPRRILKALLFLPAPFWGIRGIIAVFQAPALPFARFLLLSPLWGNLLLAGALLPFVLMLLRLGLAFPGRGILRRRSREFALAGILLARGRRACRPAADVQPIQRRAAAAAHRNAEHRGGRCGNDDRHGPPPGQPRSAGRA